MTPFFCSPSVSQTPRKVEANHLVKMWYGFPLFVFSVICSSSTSLALFICGVLMLVVCAAVSFFFFRRKFLILRLVGLWRKKWLQRHLKVWKRRPSVVALLRGPVSQYRVSRSSRILRFSNFLRSKIPNSSRLLVL